MKKADFRLPYPAGFTRLQRLIRPSPKGTNQCNSVKFRLLHAPVKKQVRIKRSDIDRDDISAEMRALGRHIAHCRKKGRAVRIPAMRGSEWGQVLRTLELKRAFN